MTKEIYDFKNYTKDELTKPRDVAWSNWASFKVVGDTVQGFIRDVFYRAADDDFGAQRGITLEQPTGELINVGIKHISYIVAKTDNLKLGDPLTIVLEKEIPNKNKKFSATKVYGFYGTNLEANKDNMTVLELEKEDKKNLLEQEVEKEDYGEVSDNSEALNNEPTGSQPKLEDAPF